MALDRIFCAGHEVFSKSGHKAEDLAPEMDLPLLYFSNLCRRSVTLEVDRSVLFHIQSGYDATAQLSIVLRDRYIMDTEALRNAEARNAGCLEPCWLSHSHELESTMLIRSSSLRCATALTFGGVARAGSAFERFLVTLLGGWHTSLNERS